ncbi:hypothetical protein [Pseudomonas veronii]|uniref:hypothetical protein n=1 Tax=Pseudomonas veronii TaxID=76761 RepID=UPI0023DEEC1D|nr:hypothetical protein [Pseudomonas veronii]MDF3240945.1 hypothetical protein [Pseudomonas veronii]
MLATEIGNLVQRVGWDSVMLEFVENIDELLYQAKHNGRMRAVLVDADNKSQAKKTPSS